MPVEEDGNAVNSSRFTSQTSTPQAPDSETGGLVNLADFRKRRADALEQKEREASNSGRSTPIPNPGAVTPSDRGSSSQQPVKKRKKVVAKGKLSFGVDADDETEESISTAGVTPRSMTPADIGGAEQRESTPSERALTPRLGANSGIRNAPKVMTKSALTKEAETREKLRKEFVAIQAIVKETEILIPFVFYDGTNIPGGKCRVKKGDHIWLFLDKARKVGAELGVGGDKSRREWARVSVDDLMLVRGDIIIPHHYDFYYFAVNKVKGFQGPIFDFSDRPTDGTTIADGKGAEETISDVNPLTRVAPRPVPRDKREDSKLEGFNHNPELTKVVDKRWYERNKHIYPASTWEDFDATKDYTKGIRKDTLGNSFFFST